MLLPWFYKSLDGNYPFLHLHHKILASCRELGIHCIDTAPALEAYRRMSRFHLHPADAHPNGRANRLLVDYLVQTDELRLEGRPVEPRPPPEPPAKVPGDALPEPPPAAAASAPTAP